MKDISIPACIAVSWMAIVLVQCHCLPRASHAVATGAVWCVHPCATLAAGQTAGGWVAKLRWQKAEGALARVKGKEFTPENGEEGGTSLVHPHVALHDALAFEYVAHTLL